MENLSDTQLLEAFKEAVHLNLKKDFIMLLETEIKHRDLPLPNLTRVCNKSSYNSSRF